MTDELYRLVAWMEDQDFPYWWDDEDVDEWMGVNVDNWDKIPEAVKDDILSDYRHFEQELEAERPFEGLPSVITQWLGERIPEVKEIVPEVKREGFVARVGSFLKRAIRRLFGRGRND